MPRFSGAPEVAASGDGRLEVFVFDFEIEGPLWHVWQTQWSNSTAWTGWCEVIQSGSWPATVAANGDGTLQLVIATGGPDMYSAKQTAWSNGWSDPTSMPAVPLPDGFFPPGVAANADGRLELFVANGSLWRLEQASWSGSWSTWQPHGFPTGAAVVGPVTAGRSGDGRIEVFVIDAGGNLWNVRQTSPAGSYTGWNAFGNPGVPLDDRPALARSADGRLELFIRGTDNQLYHQWETAVGTFSWSGWTPFNADSIPAGGLVDHPVVAPSADGRLELFLTGNDGNVYHSWQTAASNGWSTRWLSEGSAGGGFAAAAPGLGRNGDGRLQLFAVGRDGNLYTKWQTAASNGWTGWTPLDVQSPTTTVPNVIDLTGVLAENKITAARLTSSIQNPGGGEYVARQTPGAGTVVAIGSTVDLFLEKIAP
jgi:hypothetical protein